MNTMVFWKWYCIVQHVPAFQRNILPSSSRYKRKFHFYTEDRAAQPYEMLQPIYHTTSYPKVLVIRVLVFTVFCIVCTVFFVLFRLCIFIVCFVCTSVRTTDTE
jgi:hypothetical protein